MAARNYKGKAETFASPEYDTYEFSAVSEYYVFGKENAEEYARALHRIREELREAAYGEKKAAAPVETKKRINLAPIAVMILSLLTIAAFAIGYALPEGLASKYLFTGNAGAMGIGAFSIEVILVWVSLACSAIAFVISPFRIGRNTGWLLRLIAAAAFLLVGAAIAILFVNGITPGIMAWIMAVTTLGATIAALVKGNNKKAEE